MRQPPSLMSESLVAVSSGLPKYKDERPTEQDRFLHASPQNAKPLWTGEISLSCYKNNGAVDLNKETAAAAVC